MKRIRTLNDVNILTLLISILIGIAVCIPGNVFFRKAAGVYAMPVVFGVLFAFASLTLGTILMTLGFFSGKLRKNIITGQESVTSIPLFVLLGSVGSMLLGAVFGALYGSDSVLACIAMAALLGLFGALCSVIALVSYGDSTDSSMRFALKTSLVTSGIAAVIFAVLYLSGNGSEKNAILLSALLLCSCILQPAPEEHIGINTYAINPTATMREDRGSIFPVAIINIGIILAIIAASFLMPQSSTPYSSADTWKTGEEITQSGSFDKINELINRRIVEEYIPDAITESDRYSNELCSSFYFRVLKKEGKQKYSVEFTYVDVVALADMYAEETWDGETYYGRCADDMKTGAAPLKTETITVQITNEDGADKVVDSPELLNVLSGGAYNYVLSLMETEK